MASANPAVLAALARIAARKAEMEAASHSIASPQQQDLPAIPQPTAAELTTETGGFTFNVEQQAAIDIASDFQNVAIVGSAGTGKTTIMRTVASRLCRDARMPRLHIGTGKEGKLVLRKGEPGIVAVSFTHTAVNNINEALDGIIPCYTIHRLIEFAPVPHEYTNDAGETKTKMLFEPQRNRYNPLPSTLRTIIIEESGIVSITLFQMLLDAIPDVSKVQFIFLGDLFQLDPPYDPAILGFVLTSVNFKIVELTQVYRQKLLSPILQLVLDVKDRKVFGSNKFAEMCVSGEHGSLTIKPWKHRLDEFKATLEAAKFLKKEWEAGKYLPEKDCVILPFNKRFGSTELNILIADFMGKSREAVVHEIIAGYEKKYLAVGDHVAVSKRRGIITSIAVNDGYLGTQSPQPPSKFLDRFGYNGNKSMDDAKELELDANAHDEIDRLMAASLAGNEDRIRSASHVVEVMFTDKEGDETGNTVTLESSGDFALNKFDFSYCMTCYKAQGSEWKSVYIFTHKSHAVSLCNEFFYTAFSRAKFNLTVICEPDHLSKAMIKQSIPGNNWKEKAIYFKRNIAKLGALPDVAKFIMG